MRGLCAVLVVLLPACLVLNEDFVGGDSGGGTAAASTSTGTSTTSSGASASTAMGMSMEGGVVSSSTGMNACADDMYELNDQEGAAAMLPGVDFAAPELMWSAAIETADSQDWFQVRGTDELVTNLGEPTITITPTTVEMCTYVLCDSGIASTAIECDGTTTASNSPVQGLLGCCHSGDGVIPIRYSCATEATANFFIRATSPDPVCDYALRFDFPA